MVTNTQKSASSNTPEEAESVGDTLSCVGNRVEIDTVQSFLHTVELPATIDGECLLKVLKIFDRFLSTLLEFGVVKLHLDYATINATHASTTSFHTVSAILSNIGLIAGFMKSRPWT